MDIIKIAENIVDDLNNLTNKSSSIEQIQYSYRDRQIDIVFNHIRYLTNGEMKKDKSALCSILDDLFNSFRPYNPPGISTGIFFRCILGCNHLDRLKGEYANLEEEK